MKTDLILPLRVVEIINNAVTEVIKELKENDTCEYHLDGMKMDYIYGGIDLTFRIRNNVLGLRTDISSSAPGCLMKPKTKKDKEEP